MVIIHYPPSTTEIDSWKARLDATFTKYDAIIAEDITEPTLMEGELNIRGKSAIEEYIIGCEHFFAGWYEDRCDKHDFYPENDA